MLLGWRVNHHGILSTVFTWLAVHSARQQPFPRYNSLVDKAYRFARASAGDSSRCNGTMRASRISSVIENGIAIAVMGFVSFAVMSFFFAPDIKETRSEARIGEAYRQVCRIANPNPTNLEFDPLPDKDPWGQSYQLEMVNDQIVRVLSCGPNKSTPENGFDSDDIYSDMPVSPVSVIMREKNREWLIFAAISAAVWLLLSVSYLRTRSSVQTAFAFDSKNKRRVKS